MGRPKGSTNKIEEQETETFMEETPKYERVHVVRTGKKPKFGREK